MRKAKLPAGFELRIFGRALSIMRNGLTILLIVAAILTEFTESEAQALLALTRADRFAVPHSGIGDPDEFESFTDQFFRSRMEKLHVPGAAVVLVKNGAIFFKKGYGYADLDRKQLVGPDRTIFRAGSISKIFTVMALMQLEEQGLLDLADKVNDHLKIFKIANPYPNAVSVRHLITHTAGFDQLQIGRYNQVGAERESLAEALAELMPAIVSNPGEIASYSGYGIALAGYLVEALSGTPFSEYVSRHISGPLEMAYTTFDTPKQANPQHAFGYRYVDGRYLALPGENFRLAPSGSLLTTAADMANFIICHLQGGRFRGRQVLSEATTAAMHRRQIAAHPALPGWCYGFYESYENDKRAILHTGSPRGFSSVIYLLPGENLGLFLAYNSNDSRMHQQYLSSFLDRYFPSIDLAPAAVTATQQQDQRKLAGSYRLRSYSKRSIARLAYLIDDPAEVHVRTGENGLEISLPGKVIKAQATEPLVFKSRDRDQYFAFSENRQWQVTRLHLNNDKPATLERLKWWETASVQRQLLKGFLLIFALLILTFHLCVSSGKSGVKPAVVLSGVVATVNFIFLIGLYSQFDYGKLRFGVSDSLTILLYIPMVAAVLTAGLLVILARTWSTSRLDLFYSGTALITAVFFVPFLHYWNLLLF